MWQRKLRFDVRFEIPDEMQLSAQWSLGWDVSAVNTVSASFLEDPFQLRKCAHMVNQSEYAATGLKVSLCGAIRSLSALVGLDDRLYI